MSYLSLLINPRLIAPYDSFLSSCVLFCILYILSIPRLREIEFSPILKEKRETLFLSLSDINHLETSENNAFLS